VNLEKTGVERCEKPGEKVSIVLGGRRVIQSLEKADREEGRGAQKRGGKGG